MQAFVDGTQSLIINFLFYNYIISFSVGKWHAQKCNRQRCVKCMIVKQPFENTSVVSSFSVFSMRWAAIRNSTEDTTWFDVQSNLESYTFRKQIIINFGPYILFHMQTLNTVILLNMLHCYKLQIFQKPRNFITVFLLSYLPGNCFGMTPHSARPSNLTGICRNRLL